ASFSRACRAEIPALLAILAVRSDLFGTVVRHRFVAQLRSDSRVGRSAGLDQRPPRLDEDCADSVVCRLSHGDPYDYRRLVALSPADRAVPDSFGSPDNGEN